MVRIQLFLIVHILNKRWTNTVKIATNTSIKQKRFKDEANVILFEW